MKISSRILSASFTIPQHISPKSPPYNILFFGSDRFSLTCLQKLKEDNDSTVQNLEVVYLPNIKIQDNPVRQYAHYHQLPRHSWPDLPNLASFDLGLVISFGKMIPKRIIDSFSLGMFNIHGSLIPFYRGSAPISRAIEDGKTSTGCTFLEISPNKFDVGKILSKTKDIQISDEVFGSDLTEQMSISAANLLIETLKDFPNKLQQAKPQQLNEGSWAPKISLSDCFVDFSILTAEQVWNKFRAFGFKKDFHLRCSFEGKLLRFVEFLKPNTSNMTLSENPGRVRFDKMSKSLIIECLKGEIKCRKLIFVKPITAADFYNGQIQNRRKIGQVVELQAISTS